MKKHFAFPIALLLCLMPSTSRSQDLSGRLIRAEVSDSDLRQSTRLRLHGLRLNEHVISATVVRVESKLSTFSALVFDVGGQQRITFHRSGYDSNGFWYGEGRSAGEFVAISDLPSGVWGKISTPYGLFSLEPLGDSYHALSKIDVSRLPLRTRRTKGESTSAPSRTSGESTMTSRNNTGGANFALLAPPGGADDDEIELLAAYTPAVRSVMGGAQVVYDMIQSAVNELNQGLSYAGAKVKLIGVTETDYQEVVGNITIDKNRLQNPTDGIMDELHTVRANLDADVVYLWVHTAGSCGVATTWASRTTAFGAIDATCSTSDFVLGHEFGHTLGGAHIGDFRSFPVEYNRGYVVVDDPGPPRYQYSTLMKAGQGLAEPCPDCQRILRYSDPGIALGFYPNDGCGHDNCQARGYWIGTQFRNDVTRVIEDRHRVVNSFGPALVDPCEPVCPKVDQESSESPRLAAADFDPRVDVFPNPSAGHFEVHLNLQQAEVAAVDVLDLQGRVVKNLAQGELDGGVSVLSWNGRSNNGGHLASGLYILRVRERNRVSHVRIVLVR